MRKYLLLSALLLIIIIPSALNAQTWQDSLRRVDDLYRQGKFTEAELAALRLLNRSTHLSTNQQADLHRTLAFISIARDDREAGMEQFMNALRLNPRLHLDRTLTSPKIYSVFERARESFVQMNRQEWAVADVAITSYRMRLEGGKRSLLLPGLGQLYKGHREKGYAFLSATGVSIIGLAVSHSVVLRRDDRYHNSNDPDKAGQLYEEYRNAWRWRNGFGMAVILCWISGSLDAFLTEPVFNTEELDISFQVYPDNNQNISAGFTIYF